MPPFKNEAVRLREAKLAIEKMKKKREAKFKRPLSGKPPVSSTPLRAPGAVFLSQETILNAPRLPPIDWNAEPVAVKKEVMSPERAPRVLKGHDNPGPSREFKQSKSSAVNSFPSFPVKTNRTKKGGIVVRQTDSSDFSKCDIQRKKIAFSPLILNESRDESNSRLVTPVKLVINPSFPKKMNRRPNSDQGSHSNWSAKPSFPSRVQVERFSDGENDVTMLNTKEVKTLKKVEKTKVSRNGDLQEAASHIDHPLVTFKKVKKSMPLDRSSLDNKAPFHQLSKANRECFKKKSRQPKPLRHVTRTLAPMLIKMTSGTVKSPGFSTTEDDLLSRNEPRTGKLLCTNVSNLKHRKPRSTPQFTVTTVSEIDDVDEGHEEITSIGSGTESMSLESGAELPVEGQEGDDFELENDPEVDKVAHPTELSGESLNDSSKVNFHFIDDQVVLQLKHPTNFAFCGHIQVEVLKGAIDVLGYMMTPSSGCHSIISPLKSSLLQVETVSINGNDTLHPALEFGPLAEVVQEGNCDDVFLLLKKGDTMLLSYLEHYFNKKFLPRLPRCEARNSLEEANKKLESSLMPPPKHHVLTKGARWNDIFDHINQRTGCTLFSGGKNVGKSTMLRYFANRFLSNHKEGVVLIDLDPGQAELTVPGCVSLSVLKRPLLGPNYTHLQDSLKCHFVGDVNVTNCVSRYMNACLEIVEYWQSEEKFKDMPCLVNTMGFTKGLGVSIMVHLLSIVKPTCVIQIQSTSDDLNYPESLSVEYVQRMCSTSPFRLKQDNEGSPLFSLSCLDYELLEEQSLVNPRRESYSKSNPRARLNRDLSLMSYLFHCASPPNTSLLQAVPFCCSLDSIYICICHESIPPSVALSTLNASVVALCRANPGKEDILQATEPGLPSIISSQYLADCVGFGIVRGIDMDTQKIYVLTPVSEKILSSVNCLALGAVSLPEGVYLKPPKEHVFVPYVAAKRPFLPSFQC